MVSGGAKDTLLTGGASAAFAAAFPPSPCALALPQTIVVSSGDRTSSEARGLALALPLPPAWPELSAAAAARRCNLTAS